MDCKRLWLIGLALVFPLSLAFAKDEVQFSRFMTGEVTRIFGGLVTLETTEGIERDFSLVKAQENGVQGLETGDRLFLEVDEDNLIVDIARLTDKGMLKPSDKAVVVGRVVKYAEGNEEVTIKLQNGKKASYRLKDAAAAKMNGVGQGAYVKLEIDRGDNHVEDLVVSR